MTTHPRSAPSARRRAIGWILIAGVWLAALAAFELLARTYGGFVLVDGRPASLERHDEFGELTVETIGGVAVWKRPHPDRPLPRPVKEGFRIVALGDSILLPALLADRDGAVRLLEGELNARLDAGPYEVVNVSEGGWNTKQQEQVLLHEGLSLKPDLVIVGLSPNDHQQFAYRDGQLLEVEFLRALDRRRGWWTRLVSERSYLYNFLWLRWRGLRHAPQTSEDLEWSTIIEPLGRIKASVDSNDASLAIICMPLLVGDRFEPGTGGCEFEHVVAWAAQKGVPLFDPATAYSAHPTADLRLDNIHLSPLGHRVLADAVFGWLVEHRLVPYRTVREKEAARPAAQP